MKRNVLILMVGCLFFLTLTYFSIWWLVCAVFVVLLWIAYRVHRNRIDIVEALNAGLELELAEKSDQQEKAVRLEKSLRQKVGDIQRSKTAVLQQISHDIRTPMNGMMGMTSLMAQTPLTREQQEYLETIGNCGKKMITTINDILLRDMLNYSTGEKGKSLLEQKDFNIRHCIEEVLDFFAAKAAKAGIELLCLVAHDVPEQIKGDEGRLRQILLNLTENAIRYTGKGEVFINLTLRKPKKADELDIAFEVKDTGTGISEDKLIKIGRCLAHPDYSNTVTVDETGLGLIISDRLVKLMGGNLILTGIPGKGTQVLFNIIAGYSVIPQKRNPLDNFAALAGKKILLVVNHVTRGDILKTHLAYWKFNPVVTLSGKEALGILSENPGFDLLLTDFLLPDTDGIQLAQTIAYQYPGLAAILMGRSNDEDGHQYHGLFKSILPKPVKQDMLYNQVLAALLPADQQPLKEQNGTMMLSDQFSAQYPLHILIAEDNPINQQFAVKILNRLGYKPALAKNGEEVLEIVSQENFDLILMDVEMPGMDGLEATRMIRLCLQLQPVIIAMTANAMQGDREICLQSGMDDYLSKPVALEELMRILEKWAMAVKEKA